VTGRSGLSSGQPRQQNSGTLESDVAVGCAFRLRQESVADNVLALFFV